MQRNRRKHSEADILYVMRIYKYMVLCMLFDFQFWQFHHWMMQNINVNDENKTRFGDIRNKLSFGSHLSTRSCDFTVTQATPKAKICFLEFPCRTKCANQRSLCFEPLGDPASTRTADLYGPPPGRKRSCQSDSGALSPERPPFCKKTLLRLQLLGWWV